MSNGTAFYITVAFVTGFAFGVIFISLPTNGGDCAKHFVRETIEWNRCVERLADGDLMSQILEDTR